MRGIFSPHPQMDLHFARRSEHRRLYFGITRVNRPCQMIDMRFAKPCNAQFAMKHAHRRDAAVQARQHLFAKHRLQFARRPGQQRDHRLTSFKPQARRRPPRVIERLAALWHHRLAQICFGHGPAKRSKSGFNRPHNQVTAYQPAPEQFRHSFPCQIIFCRAEPAR